MGMAVAGGAQAALLAPTSILADQHLGRLRALLVAGTGLPRRVDPPVDRRHSGGGEGRNPQEACSRATSASSSGTHALLEEPVTFARLGLAVIDEQHRFGVEQRAALRAKGANPHLLVMTATPIPRSLALTVFGDLDLTVLDEMPPGRQPIETRICSGRLNARGPISFVVGSAGSRAPGLYHLSAGRRIGEGRGQGGGRRAPSPAAGRLSRLSRRAAPWPAAPDDKDEVMAPVPTGENSTSWSRPRWSKSGSTCPTPR